MKLKLAFFVAFFLVVLLMIIYLFMNIYTDIFDYRGAGFSGDIESSKRLGVFRGEYVIVPETLNIDGIFALRFGKVWAERKWSHGNYFKPVKEPSREEWKGYNIFIEIIGTADFASQMYDKYSVHTIDSDSNLNSFALKYVYGANVFLFKNFRKLDNNEMKIFIEERETDSTKSDLRKTFFTIRKK